MAPTIGLELGDDPYVVFEHWFADACAEEAQPEAVAFASASRIGVPSVRMMLFKGLADGRFRFFTNYGSRKARELDSNPRAALLFFWQSLARQIRIEGRVLRMSAAQSSAYFSERDRDSQLGALASKQSKPIESRAALLGCVETMRMQYEGHDVPCPAYWGGYELLPQSFEFWQGRPGRLHDRVEFTKKLGGWRTQLLAP